MAKINVAKITSKPVHRCLRSTSIISMTSEHPKFCEVDCLIGGDGEYNINVDVNADQNAYYSDQQQHELDVTVLMKIRHLLAQFDEETFVKQMLYLKQRWEFRCGRNCLAKLNGPVNILKAQLLAFISIFGPSDTCNRVYRCFYLTSFPCHVNSENNHC